MRDLNELPDLELALIQTELAWQDAKANRERFATQLEQARGADLVVLPEMFTTGFSMDSAALAEPEEGPTYHWLREQAARLDAVVTGSVIIEAADGSHRNRLLWARPDGEVLHYDKRHLFRMAGEHKHYTRLAGTSADLLRPALPGLEPRSAWHRPAALHRQLAGGAARRLEPPAAGACHREPVLCRCRQPRRRGWQRLSI